MAGGEIHEHLGTLFGPGAPGGMADGELLGRFLEGDAGQAEAAMAALVERHGPMVMRVCRRVLRDGHDAQDAFQATFLVLVRRAGSIRRADSLASWLHGVALRVARKALAGSVRRREREREGAGREAAWPEEEARWAELHEEVARLPARYREPVVLCYLMGMTTEAAASRLGCPRGTVLSRLARGRDRLREGLARRGYASQAGAAVAALAEAGAPPALAGGLAGSTARIAVLFATTSAASGAVGAVALARGVLRAMLLNRAGGVGVGLLVAGVVGLGSWGLVDGSPAAGPVAAAGPLPAPAVVAEPIPAAAAVAGPPPAAAVEPAQFGGGTEVKGPGRWVSLTMGRLVVFGSADQRRWTVYDGETGEASTVEFPEGVACTPYASKEMVTLVLRGEGITRLAVYSPRVEGGWSTQELPEPVAGEIVPAVGVHIAVFRAGKRAYAFSTLRGRWSELELTGDGEVGVVGLPGSDICLVEDGGKLFAISAEAGRWAEIPVGD